MEIPPPAKLHKEGSSNQLFVLLEEEEESTARGQAITPVGGDLETGRRSLAAKQDIFRCSSTALVAAGVAALVSCVMLAVGVPWLQSHHRQPEPLAPPQQKSIVMGDPRYPQALPTAPKQKIVTLGHPAYHCQYDMAPACPARELFANSELHEVATENLMQVGHGILTHADRDMVRSTVAAGFKNLSRQLDEHSPAAASALAQIKLNETQKNAVLTNMRLMSIPEVQRIGFEVALAVRRSLSMEKEAIQHQIEDMLRSNIKEIKRLRDEMVPASVLEFWNVGHYWQMTLERENIEIMEAFHGGKFFGSMNASFYADSLPKTPKKLPPKEKAYAAWGGLLEEGRALIDMIKLIAWSTGDGLDVPSSATSLRHNIDVKDLGSELLSCELHEKSGMNNLMKAFFCPLKYGSQGMDALRTVDRLLRSQEKKVA